MKRGIILILILLTINVASALTLNMNSEFSQGETLFAVLNGDISNTLTSNNIQFYRGHVKVPVDISFLKDEDSYYITGQLIGKQPGNYSIELTGLTYYELQQLKNTTITQNFTITEDIADFLVRPATLSVEDNFEITVENLKSSSITIQIESPFESIESVDVSSGKSKTIEFDIESINETGVYFINLSSENTHYDIPVYFVKVNESKNIRLEREPEEFQVGMSSNVSYNYSRIIRLFNKGDVMFENISLNLSEDLQDYAEISTYFIDELDKDDNVSFGVFFYPGDIPEVIYGEINIQIDSPDLNYTIPVMLNISESYIPLDSDSEVDLTNGSSDIVLIKSCAQLGGIVCTSTQTCGGTIKTSREGNCCIGTCKEDTSSSSTSKIIGWILIIAIVGFGIWFYFKKYKGTAPSINLLKEARPKI